MTNVADGIKGLLLFGIYFGSARLGLLLETDSQFVTLVWPPTAIAVAALYLFGIRFWPVVAAGALSVNFSVGAPLWVAGGIALGNTLEAVVAAYGMRKAIGLNTQLNRLQHVLVLVVWAAGASTLLSASIGTASLFLGELITREVFWSTWRAWWVGDALSALVLAPFLLVWRIRPRFVQEPISLVEFALLSVAVVGLTFFTFGPGSADRSSVTLLPYFIFPLLAWASIRFKQHANTAFVLALSVIAIWGTVLNEGPFHTGNLPHRLLFLQIFVGTVAITALFFGALGREKAHALDLRTQFLSVASHELKTPLTIMMGQVHMAKRSLESGRPMEDGDRMERLVFSMDRQLKRLAKLIENLLDVSRLQRGQLALEKEWVDLSAVVREVVERFKPQLEAAGCSLNTRFVPALEGCWDRFRLEQVVTNLLANAIKYGRGGPIEVALRTEGDSAQFVVQDSGEGIAKEDRFRIFEPFERAVADQKIGGLGLGLFICKQIVEAHSGIIRVEGEPGHGSTFIVELPIGSA